MELSHEVRREETTEILRVCTAGSVDDGKSTLIGRLLYETDSLHHDHIKEVRQKSRNSDLPGQLDFSLITDGLKDERSQRITIDVAYRYFSSKARRYILIDSPGHEQYTSNMVTGSSSADVAILLLDVTKGITDQSRRHAFILNLMGIRQVTVAINKMDLVEFSEEKFSQLKESFLQFSARLKNTQFSFIPVSSLLGDNITVRSQRMSWFNGPTILGLLDQYELSGHRNLVDLRLPIQYVLKHGREERAYAGQLASGVLRKNQLVHILPAGREATVTQISNGEKDVECAVAGQSVALRFDREIDVHRGSMICGASNLAHSTLHCECLLIWLSDKAMNPDQLYKLRHTTNLVSARIDRIEYIFDVANLSRKTGQPLRCNEIGRVKLLLGQAIHTDVFETHRNTGSFILIDPEHNSTVAAGLVHSRLSPQSEKIQPKARTFWLTGLSGSGKSTLAQAVNDELKRLNIPVFVLDGDALRSGINSDLGFSNEDRAENVRRTAELCKILNSAGIHVLAALISPNAVDRTRARSIVGDGDFYEIYLSASLENCEQRDPKGLYRKVRQGEIKNFTGIDSPYEAPTEPDLVLQTAQESVDVCLARLMGFIAERIRLSNS